jgi:hypothetical protein
MTKTYIKKTMLWALAALIIPLLGNTFVDGWNWTWHDFLFAWVFFVILGLSVKFVTSKIADRTFRIAAGVAVVLVFAAIWATLATG